jgi:O-antigen/teichoic acid export membrane protein
VKPDVAETAGPAFPGGLRPFLMRAVAGSGAVHLAGMLFTFLVGVQLARGLGVQGYGQYGIALAAISLASIPTEFGTPKLLTREVASSAARNDVPGLFGVLRWADRTALLLSLAAALLLAAGGFLFAIEESSAIAWAILFGAPMIPLVALARNRGAALQGLHHVIRGQVPFILIRPIAFSLLLFLTFALVPGAGAPQAMALNAVTAALAMVLGQLWLSRRLPPRPAAIGTGSSRAWMKSALSMALADGMRLGHFHVATLLLGLLASASDVGLFRIATSIAAVIGLPMLLMNTIVSPIVTRLHAESDQRRLQRLCTASARATTLGIAMLTLPFLFWGEGLIGAVFGGGFAPANTALLIVAAGLVVDAAFGHNASLLMMTGHEHRVTRAMFWGLLVSVVLTLALVPLWAEVGAAMATVGSLVVWNILTWLDARRLIGIETSIAPDR